MSDSIIRLNSGRRVVAHDGPERVQLIAPDGTIELEIDLSSGKPRVKLSAASLELAVEGDLRLAADHIALDAKRGVQVRTDGELALHAEADVVVTGKVIHLN